MSMPKNYLIGRGELLAEPVRPPAIKPTKTHPYDPQEARQRLAPQMDAALAGLVEEAEFAPDGVHVMRFTLHPAYIAKSYYPDGLFRLAGLEPVGSRERKVYPETHVVKDWREREFSTSEIFVAGTEKSFRDFGRWLSSDSSIGGALEEIREIESIDVFSSGEKLKAGVTDSAAFEVVVHLPSERLAPHNRQSFIELADSLGVGVGQDLGVEVRGLWFLPVTGEKAAVERLAEFSTVRVVRPMPTLTLSPVTRLLADPARVEIPTPTSIDESARVAILDGGLPPEHALGAWVASYREMDPDAPRSSEFEAHGLAVASAFLFGHLEAGEQVRTPPARVSVFRVLDGSTDGDDPYELYRALGHIEAILLSRNFDYVNLSLGPDLPIEDDEVHAWTALIDDLLSDGETLMTVAVGNNGNRDEASGNARVQVPSDAVNALAIGSAGSLGEGWGRASYSAIGPGSTPGTVKPDLLAFGGSDGEEFRFLAPGTTPTVALGQGTSLSAPLALRQAVGIHSLLAGQIEPLGVRALLLHAARDSGHARAEVGWGRLPLDVDAIASVGDGVARILYQGELRPGKYLRAALPRPEGGFIGDVSVSATFCFASPVDTQSPDLYTRAGLEVVFRPDLNKFGKGAKTPSSRSFFSPAAYSDEALLRADQGKWETVLNATDRMRGATLGDPVFDIHYNARDGGGSSRETAPLKYALVITLEAPKMVNLHQDILDAYPGVLLPIEPIVEIDLDA